MLPLRIVIALLLAATASAATYKKGDKVRAKWEDKEYTATILEVVGKRYKLHYDGYEAEWDEVVEPSRILGPVTPASKESSKRIWKKGDKVQVKYTDGWYPAVILKADPVHGLYYVHYDGWGADSDEEVGSDRIGPRPSGRK